MKKKLYKSNDKIIAGVIGGISEYFDTDPTILRILYVLIAILTGFFPAVIGYIIAALIIPQKPSVAHMEHTEPSTSNSETKTEPEKTN